MPCPVLAESSIEGICPPKDSTIISFLANSPLTLSG